MLKIEFFGRTILNDTNLGGDDREKAYSSRDGY